jgi:hypothetical protein
MGYRRRGSPPAVRGKTMLRRIGSAPVFGVALIAGLLFIAPRLALAQGSATYSTMTQPSGQQARKPAAKPAPAQNYATVNPAEQADYWAVNSSVGAQYSSGAKPQAAAKSGQQARAVPSERTALDRVQLRDAPGGSIGIAAGDSTRGGRFNDGRNVPGLTANTQNESSYVGMSLSVSSNNKGLPFPLPGPAYGRPE